MPPDVPQMLPDAPLMPVKGVKFKGHEVVGDILTLAKAYSDAGADELVFYEISASYSY